jgi:hypothetical protein
MLSALVQSFPQILTQMLHSRYARLALVALCVLALAGCATCPPPKTEYRRYRRQMRKQGWRNVQHPTPTAPGAVATARSAPPVFAA